MPPKWAKNSEPEDEQILCRLDVKQKLSASTLRIKMKLVPHCLTQHGGSSGMSKEIEIQVIMFWGSVELFSVSGELHKWY